jgi:hypothetical protein
MKKIYAFIIVAIPALLFFRCKDADNKIRTLGAPQDIGHEEDAKGRLEFEQMRLCDPATGKIPMYVREKELAFAATLPNDAQINMPDGALPVFQQRGPWNVGGRTRAFAVDVANENVLIAGSASGGMWRSDDGGNSWAPTTTLTQHQSVTCVVQDRRPGHQNVWYYGSGEAYGQSATATGAYYIGYGIYKSTDSAKTWNPIAATVSGNTTGFDIWGDIIWDLAVDASDSTHEVVYAASYAGIYRTLNGGTSWALVKGSPPTNATISYFTDVEVTPAGKVYATLSSDGTSSDRGIWRSTDGLTYTNITPSNFPTSYDRLKICYDPSQRKRVIFSRTNSRFWSARYKLPR